MASGSSSNSCSMRQVATGGASSSSSSCSSSDSSMQRQATGGSCSSSGHSSRLRRQTRSDPPLRALLDRGCSRSGPWGQHLFTAAAAVSGGEEAAQWAARDQEARQPRAQPAAHAAGLPGQTAAADSNGAVNSSQSPQLHQYQSGGEVAAQWAAKAKRRGSRGNSRRPSSRMAGYR